MSSPIPGIDFRVERDYGMYRNSGASIIEGATRVLNEINDTFNLKVKTKTGPKAPGGGNANDIPDIAPPDEATQRTRAINKDDFRKTLGNLLVKIVANAKIDTDLVVAEQTENRLKAEKTAYETTSKRQSEKIEENLKAMEEASRNEGVMKAFSWAMTALSVLIAIVTAGVGIAASVTAGAVAAASAAGGAAASAAAVTAAADVAAVGATVGAASTAAAGAATATVVSAAAMAGGSIVVDGVMVSTTAAGGFTLSLAGATAASSTLVVETASVSTAQAVSVAMKSVSSALKIAGAAVGVAAAVGMQIANETGDLDKARESMADDFRKNGMKSKDADLAASILMGVIQVVAVLIPGLASIPLMTGLFSFFKLGMAAQLAIFAGMSAVTLTMTTPQQAITIKAQYDAAMAGADVQEVQAMIQLINQMMDENQEELQDVLDKLQNSLSKLTDIILSALDTQKEIADNMAKVV